MRFNELSLRKNRKSSRVGRGISAGKGKTAGRGTKGQGARKSGGVRPGFEGGQMPLYMRIPKLRGFKSHRPKPIEVKTSLLASLGKSKVDAATLAESGIIENPYLKVKVITDKPLDKKMEVNLPLASTSAKAAIEKAGGSFNPTPQLKRPKTSKKKTK